MDIPANRLQLTANQRLAVIERRRGNPSPGELKARAERPYQRCPDCGREEAAHWYCSLCYLPMGADDWIATLLSEEGVAARQRNAAKARATVKAVRESEPDPGVDHAPVNRNRPIPARKRGAR